MEPDPGPDDGLTGAVGRAAARELASRLGLVLEPHLWNRMQRERFARRAQGEGIRFLAPIEDDDATSAARQANRAQTLCFLADARAISRTLKNEGIPHRFVYGLPLLRLYPDAALRPLADLDLWVPSRRRAEASETLRSLGFARAFHGDWVLRRLRPTPCNLDLHERTLPLSEPELLAGGREALGVPCLAPTEEILSLVWRALIHHGRYRLLWLADLALLLAREADRVDRAKLSEAARSRRMALPLAHTAARLVPFAAWADPSILRAARLRRPTLGERAILSFWDGMGFRGAGGLVEDYWTGLAVHGQARNALRTLFPNRDFIARRYRASGPGLLLARCARPFRLALRMARLLAGSRLFFRSA